MSANPENVGFDIDDYAEPCEHCGDGDPVPAKGYWICPVCDAEWNTDGEEDDDQQL